jgi:hypothetical protein
MINGRALAFSLRTPHSCPAPVLKPPPRDVATELIRAGHTPVVYSPHLGPIAEEFEADGVNAEELCSEMNTLRIAIQQRQGKPFPW